MKSQLGLGALRAAFAAALLTGISSCASLSVESEPPGAKVLWSADGVTEWQPWPPASWRSTAAGSGSATPLKTEGPFGDSLFVTVEKEGYRRPLPRPVQLYAGKSEKVRFVLDELPEAYAARQRANGLVLYNKQWVDPVANGLVERDGVVMPAADAYRLDQISKGLVLHEGEWLTPDDRDQRVAEAMTSQGLVRYKLRWMTPEEKETEERIDAEVAQVKASKDYPDVPTPRVTSAGQRTHAQLQFSNSTGQVIRILVSGEVSREFTVIPYGSLGIRRDDVVLVPEGRYNIAILPTGKDATGQDLVALLGRMEGDKALSLSITPLWGGWPLAAGQQYSFNYTGATTDLRESLRNFSIPETKLNFTPPTIEVPAATPAPPAEPGAEGRRPGTRPPGAEGGRPPGGGGGEGGGGRRSRPPQ